MRNPHGGQIEYRLGTSWHLAGASATRAPVFSSPTTTGTALGSRTDVVPLNCVCFSLLGEIHLHMTQETTRDFVRRNFFTYVRSLVVLALRFVLSLTSSRCPSPQRELHVVWGCGGRSWGKRRAAAHSMASDLALLLVSDEQLAIGGAEAGGGDGTC